MWQSPVEPTVVRQLENIFLPQQRCEGRRRRSGNC